MNGFAPAMQQAETASGPESVRPQTTRPSTIIGNQALLRRLQAKLTIGDVDDPLEHETDAVAQRVMRMPDPAFGFTAATSRISRKCANCEENHKLQANCASCANEDKVQAKRSDGNLEGGEAPASVDAMLRSSGQPLDPGLRNFFEPRFGADFSDVRVHTDERAADSARDVSALAYTVGSNIVFDSGRFSSATNSGRQLIAHELAHVVQQSKDSARLSRGRNEVQRVIKSPTPADASEVAGHLNVLCSGSFTTSGNDVTVASGGCLKSSAGCDCACVAANDPQREYDINPRPANIDKKTETLWDKTTQTFPHSSFWPRTTGGGSAMVDIDIPTLGSKMEFGAFRSDGTAFWYPTWRILGHEICGHGLTGVGGGPTGNRPAHDDSINLENKIAAEHKLPERGHFTDRRQGEAFTNPVGNQTKIAFKNQDGWHYEAP